MPSLSASGSVPRTISALISFASAMTFCIASALSGFGSFTVGKDPSGAFCSSTTATSIPSLESIVVRGTKPEPWRGVYATFTGLFFTSSGLLREEMTISK